MHAGQTRPRSNAATSAAISSGRDGGNEDERQGVAAMIDPLDVLRARAEARAYLVTICELDLADAVDEL